MGKSIDTFQDTGMLSMDKIIRLFDNYNRHIINLSERKMWSKMFCDERRKIFALMMRQLDELEDLLQKEMRQFDAFVDIHRDIIREQRSMSANASLISRESWKSIAIVWFPFVRLSGRVNSVDYMGKVNSCTTSMLRGHSELEAVMGSIERLRNSVNRGEQSIDGGIPLDGDGEQLNDRWEARLELRLFEERRQIDIWQSTRNPEKEVSDGMELEGMDTQTIISVRSFSGEWCQY